MRKARPSLRPKQPLPAKQVAEWLFCCSVLSALTQLQLNVINSPRAELLGCSCCLAVPYMPQN